MKVCRKCGFLKEAFYKNAARSDGLGDWCKGCMDAYQKQRMRDPEVRKRHIAKVAARYASLTPAQREERVKRGSARATETGAYLRQKYRITNDEYQEILKAQGGGCAICGKQPQSDGRRMPVDHDHACCPGTKTCGKCIRGILCLTCNVWLGFYENKQWLDRAEMYLNQ